MDRNSEVQSLPFFGQTEKCNKGITSSKKLLVAMPLLLVALCAREKAPRSVLAPVLIQFYLNLNRFLSIILNSNSCF